MTAGVAASSSSSGGTGSSAALLLRRRAGGLPPPLNRPLSIVASWARSRVAIYMKWLRGLHERRGRGCRFFVFALFATPAKLYLIGRYCVNEFI